MHAFFRSEKVLDLQNQRLLVEHRHLEIGVVAHRHKHRVHVTEPGRRVRMRRPERQHPERERRLHGSTHFLRFRRGRVRRSLRRRSRSHHTRADKRCNRHRTKSCNNLHCA
eukprot:Amastigsp_a841495_34.p4 type:complete len:111 gc:universal Amastigsp_a841495_34:599-931(+)